MKLLLIVFLFLANQSVYAQWSGDILCVKPSQNITEYPLMADAIGRISVKLVDGFAVAEIALSDLRLFSEFGSVKGSVLKSLTLSGDVGDGNDHWFSKTKPLIKNKIIKNIQFDLSSIDRVLTTITTVKNNKYVMDCIVRQD